MEIKIIHQVDKTSTIKDLLDELKIHEHRLCISINDHYPENLTEYFIVHEGDKVEITPEFQGGDGGGTKVLTSVISIAAIVAASAIAPGVGGVGLTGLQAAGLKTAVLVGSTLLIGGIAILTRPGQDNKNDENKTNRPDYSLSVGSNGFRINGPLPIVMGEMRVFPDFSSKPYNEYKYSETLFFNTFLWQTEFYTESSLSFASSSSIVVGGVTFNYSFIGTGPVDDFVRWGDVAHTYYPTRSEAEDTINPVAATSYVQFSLVFVTSNSLVDPNFTNVFVPWIDLAANGINSSPLVTNPVGPDFETSYVRYLYNEGPSSLNLLNEVVKETLNYGYGDLSITDSKIISTEANDYRNFDFFFTNQTETNWSLIQGEISFSTNPGLISNEYFNYVNGHVDTVDGGLLSNNVTSGDFSFPNNWVLRKGPVKNSTFGIQLDIEGRILRSDPINGGVSQLAREFQFQYREVGGVWTNFSNAMWSVNFDPFIINAATMNNVFRETLYVDGLPDGNYEVRARKLDPDESDKDNVCEIYLKRVRFYQRDENYNYIAQNRQSIIVNSSSQIYGTLDRLSSLVSAKCWAWDGTTYTWQETSNPADWYLYFARGGFINAESDGSLSYPYSPTIGWQNNADHPDNGERLFGAGKSDSQIDFDSIQAWWQFCDDKDLSFNALLDSKRNPLDVLYEIASVGRASVTYTNGKLGVVWEDANQPVVAMFTPDNIIKDSFSINYLNQKLTDKIIGQYIDANEEYSAQNVEAIVPGVTNPTEETNINLWGVTNEDQAQRAVNLIAARQLYQKRNITFSTDAEGMMFSKGDVVTLSHDVSQWGYSGRITDLEHDGTNIVNFGVTCMVDDSTTTVNIRDIHNNITSYTCTVTNNRVYLTSPWPLVNGPFYLNQAGTITNAISIFSDSYPDDFIFLAGNVATPGKKARIYEIRARSMNLLDMVCIDEENALYAHEYDNTYVAPDDPSRIKAVVSNAGFIKVKSGEGYITWDRDGCEAVSILLSVNGGPSVPFIDNNSATIYSNQAWLYYGDGTNITAIISPVVVDTPFESISATVSFTI